jgi:hypothetical protein
MTVPPVSYRRAFWSSRDHLWLALLTVGLGFASGHPLALWLGLTAYAIGWVFWPDSASFRRRFDERVAQDRLLAETQQLGEFRAQQKLLVSGLSSERRQLYDTLASVCRDIETASIEPQATTGLDLSSRFRQLDELMWAYLRMLSIEQSLDTYLATEHGEPLAVQTERLRKETEVLRLEVEALRQVTPRPANLDAKERLLRSQQERCTGLEQRLNRIAEASTNLELVRSEQERLIELIKLIRADTVASRNTNALSDRIDLSIEQLTTTNQWLAEMTRFKDFAGPLPDLPQRVGYVDPSRPPQPPKIQSPLAR